MTEVNEQALPETAPEPETPSPAVPEKKPVTWEAVILFALAFLAALWYGFGHNLFSGHYYGPGIGLTISHWILTASVLILAKVRNTLKFTPQGIFLLALSLLLSAVFGIFANGYMKLMNLPVLLLLTAQALFTLTGHITFNPLSGQGLWEGIRRYFPSLFRCWCVPFRALSWRHRQGGERKVKAEQIFFGIFAALGAAILALVILSSADEMFSGMMNSAMEQIGKIDGEFVAKLLLSSLLAVLLFSHRVSMLQSPAKLSPVSPGEKSPVTFRMILAALAIVYGLFAYVQVRYLFLGTESVQMSGGYAAYARSGFFQLVMVALLTLCLILPALILCRQDKPVKILCAIVALLTIVIDVSAFIRMRLYIGAYGLTTLRIVTLWGTGMIFLALIAAIVKVFLPDVRICPVLTAIALTTWIGLNYTNIDRMVAENQVARFNEDFRNETWISIKENDAYWTERISDLASDQYWSPDYYPAFEKIDNKKARAKALLLLKTRGNKKEPGNTVPYKAVPIYDWSLSFLHIPKE